MSFRAEYSGDVEYMKSGVIPFPHGFTTRRGGVSTGIWESLNLGENRGDDPENVRENYRRIGKALGMDTEKMAFTRQVHGNTVRIVGVRDARAPFDPLPYEADGVATDVPGLPLIAFTADCVPVVLCDAKAKVVAAVHCGWRSTVADILKNALEAMAGLGAEAVNISAAIGPAIGKCCFETGEDVRRAVAALLGGEQGLCPRESGKTDKYLVDLRGACRIRLLQLGLKPENIDVSEECTVCRSDKYWSHRATHGQRGSQAALIMIP